MISDDIIEEAVTCIEIGLRGLEENERVSIAATWLALVAHRSMPNEAKDGFCRALCSLLQEWTDTSIRVKWVDRGKARE